MFINLHQCQLLALILFVSNVALPPVEANQNVQSEDHSEQQSAILIRNKRQAGSMCPSRPASTSAEQTRSYLVIYSPIKRADVKVSLGSSSTVRKIESNGFNSSIPTQIYLHAYTQNARSPWLLNIRRRFDEMFPQGDQEQPPFNLLFFDWSSYSQQQYSSASSWVPHLGLVLAQFLNQLVETRSYNMTDMHLISYSLSTHISGLAGREMSSDRRLGQITALDPTGVCFHENNNFARKYNLKPKDADLVVAKHYDMGGLGSKRLIGGVDILVNGGKNQPSGNRRSKRAADSDMLVLQANSHFRASEHATDRVHEVCHEVAYACSSYQAFLDGECGDCGSNNNKCFLLSMMDVSHNNDTDSTRFRRGTKMFIKTAPASPFCLHHYQVVLKLNQNATSEAKKLITSKGLRLSLGSDLRVNMKHNAGDATYTALVTRRKPAKTASTVSLRSKERSTMKDSIKYVELNYLSHPEQDERAKASARYCPGGSSSGLIRC